MKKLQYKKIFIMLLSVIMVVTSIPFTATAATTNDEGYIEIRTIEELYNVRDDLTANYILMNDINLTEATAEGGEWDYEGRGWNPIGSNDIYGAEEFSGTFDGNGYTIKGMRIDVKKLPAGSDKTIYVGLFAKITGNIVNLHMENASIYVEAETSTSNVGGLAASAKQGKIDKCTVSGEITVKGASSKCYVGGIIGYNEADISRSNADILLDARGKGSSSSSGYAGGITSYNTGKIELCYVKGSIRGYGDTSNSYTDSSYGYAGGIAGYNLGTIYNCYNIASVDTGAYYAKQSYAGGIAGDSASNVIVGCYNIGRITSLEKNSDHAITNAAVSKCFYLQNTGIGCNGAASLTESQMLLQSMYKGLDFDTVWMMNTEAEYPYPQLVDNIQDDRVFKEMRISSLPNKVVYEKWEELDLTGCVLEIQYLNTETEYVDVTKEMVTGFNSNVAGEKVLTITYGNHSVDFVISVSEKEFKEIYTILDLYNVRYDLDGNYILMNDIDLTEATAEGGTWDFDGRGWNPIGSEDVYDTSEFRGIFDGNGHSIIGMRINVTNVPEGTSECASAGLFACVSGTVKNLTMQDVDINISIGRAFVSGAVAAEVALEGRIENCSVKGTIAGSGGKYSSHTLSSIVTGGISGRSSGVISNCKTDVSVSAACYGIGYYTTSYVGAISGANSGIVQYCYTCGNVDARGGTYSSYSGSAYAGGISGTNSGTIVDSYNSAKVQAPSAYSSSYAYAGGISANSQEKLISNCYNIGKVSAVSANQAYGIANAKVTNCYYLNDTGINTNGATALTRTQMKSQEVYVGFDFENVWYIDAKANYPYPQLIENVNDIRVIKSAKIFSLPDKMQYTKGEELDVTGLQLVFEYENAETEYVIVTNDMVTGFASDTVARQKLSTTYHDRVFTFEVTVNEKPFVEIYTVEDLYDVRYDLDGNYILMNDIDLTSATEVGGEWDFEGRGWNPIGSNDVYGKSAFSGIFDGNGHSIIGMRIDASRYPSGSGSSVYVGLFSYVTGEIRNLQMKNINIEKVAYNSDYYNMYFYVGGITGYNSGVIRTCRTSGSINATQGVRSEHVEMHVGGIGGYNDGTIRQSYNNTDVSSWWYAGGVAGYNTKVIENCYNNGKIDSVGYYKSDWSSYGYPYAGGITSQNSGKGTIVNCYNIGLVSANNASNAYAIAKGSNIDSSYYMSDVGVGVAGATVLTETQMKLEAMYQGFDFDNVWVLNSHANYPYAQLRNNVQDLDETVELIRVIAYPIKTEYLTDDIVDPIGGMFEAVYISGKTELLEITADMISGYDPKAIGEQTLTVTYGGQTDTFTINVSRRPEVTSVELVSGPTQKEFVIGTTFDFNGAKIRVSYDNDTSEIIDVINEMTTGGNINHISSQTITVNYGGQTVTFDVKVIPASISWIEITNLPSKLEYMEGEEFDTTGMVVMATYSNGSTVQLKSGYKVTGYSSEPGIHKVTIEFAGQKATFDVTVNERVLLNLEIKAKPDKLNYVVGEELDLTGLLVVASYENGDLDIIEDYTVSGLDGKAGSKVITLTYKGKTASFVVNVAVKCVERIEIIKMPTKLSYIESEALNVEGMIVKATYNDGEIKTITDYKLEGYSSLPGVHTVYVSYEGQVDSFDVNVTEKVLSDLKVTIPTKTTYEIGETFDATGMVVTAYYNNGQQYSVDNYVMSEFDSNSAGAKEIKITYEGMTRSFVVTVVEKTPIETGGKIEVGTGKVRLGETISVPVTITKNTGLSAFCHTITFDANDLAFKKVNLQGGFANGTVIINNEKVASGEITVLWFQANNVMESGVAYALEFEVLETATDGISDITIAFDANENGNASGENVLFEAVNGSVEVLSYWLGDLNGDRKYAMADLLQLAQYVSGQTMTLNDKQKLSADVNEDGIIDIHDVTLLSQWLLAADM